MNDPFPDGDVEDLIRGPVEDLLRFAGREVEVVTPHPTTEYDDQGDPLSAGEDSATTHAEFVERGEPRFAERAEGYEITVDGIVWLPSSIESEIDVTAGEGDREQDATRINDPATGRWRIEYVVHERNGKLRCICRRLSR